ncbi:putative cobalt transporter in sulfate-reducing delta-proteobacteria [hydrocarbon metagenome]|uniref:Putative cobalt transporter in sulfate-reducing delta-proteobacteria n=1 Tax=hydrocarbon metagenome TaxID=938273 RepID=A0A0W8FIE4_9ZZZZ
MTGMIGVLSGTAALASDLLLRTVPIVIAGVLAAELLVALRIVDRIARVARPITSFSHLPPECGASFMMAFISPQAADAMLVDYHHQHFIGRRELIIAALLNSFPSIVMHWRYLIPVYAPLLGIYGMIYFFLLMAVGFFQTAIVMVAGRMLLPSPGDREHQAAPSRSASSWRIVATVTLAASARTLRRILVIMVPTIVFVAFLIQVGFFDALAAYMEGVSRYFPVPAEGLGVIAAKFGSYIAAASVASALLASGDLSGRDVVITLLVGNLLSSLVMSMRWFGSFYVAIFGPRLGTEIMLISASIRNGIVFLIIFLLAWAW